MVWIQNNVEYVWKSLLQDKEKVNIFVMSSVVHPFKRITNNNITNNNNNTTNNNNNIGRYSKNFWPKLSYVSHFVKKSPICVPFWGESPGT